MIRKLLNQNSRFRNIRSVKTFTRDDENIKKCLQTLATYELQGLSTNAVAKPPQMLLLSYYRPNTFLLYKIDKLTMEPPVLNTSYLYIKDMI